MVTYADYEKKEKSLTLEDFKRIHASIASVIVDEDAEELYEELVSASIKYSAMRSRWLTLSREEKMSTDESRTLLHNSLIVKLNQLSKYSALNGRDTSWRDELGYEENDKFNRKRIGDFGCYIAFIQGINAR